MRILTRSITCLLLATLLGACNLHSSQKTDEPITRQDVVNDFETRWAKLVNERGSRNPHFGIIRFEEDGPVAFRLRHRLKNSYLVTMDFYKTEQNDAGTFATSYWNYRYRFYRGKYGDVVLGDEIKGDVRTSQVLR
ncbi:hypothetical protein C8P68_105300 [Mucilaginibacter yixingensis]|uniref:Lipoprotein n=1 Tax=Mucilaginibacter yixingensis TaxID=1295612 RepID=A0A2T5J8L3_9SPHI|nr:hypothetical protein [Mucilaginibacter yixingensis]PTQ95790.1 hypothetical protein C8P68_105300 [Mucilaginibacter yixingensis]